MKLKFLLLLSVCTLLWCSGAYAQQWTAQGGVAFSPSSVALTSMALGKNDTPYIAYRDLGHNNAASVMKFNGTAWVFVGTPGFSNTISNFDPENSLILKMDTSGKPYIFFQDSVAPPFSVMTYNGSSWVYIDSPGIAVTQPQPYSLSMDIAPNGTPYIAFIDGNHSYAASVYKHTNTGWTSVGPINFTAGGADNLCLRIDHSGTPWLAFADGNVNARLSVQKYNGSNWILQGTEGFAYPEFAANAVSMDFDNSNTPYVAYGDYSNSSNASVKKFVGGAWQAVGDTDFSADKAEYMNIRITSGGVPVVAYSDKNASYKATAKYFNGSSWVSLGTPDFSAGEADWVSLAISKTGVPYIGFVDAPNGHAASVFSFGVPAGISEINDLTDLSVYPNPNNGSFAVKLHTTQTDELQMGLYNMMGQQVWQDSPISVNGSYTQTINVAGLSQGVYMLRIQSQNGIESRKIEIK